MIKKGTPILIPGEDLLSIVSQEEIAHRYISGYEGVGKSFKSEFRKGEDLASSRVYWGDHGDLMFKDFGDPMFPKAISVVKYVQTKYQLDYQEAINKIAIDLGIVKGNKGEYSVVKAIRKSKVKREAKPPSNLIIKVKRRDWSDADIAYWGDYNIPTSMLERNKVYPISHVFYNHYPPIEYSKNHLIYSYDYYWHKNIFRRKIYQPKSENEKWRTNTDYTVVQNYPNIPKSGDLLFIQSSFKDCMVMELLGFHSIAPNKEGSWMPDYYWEKLQERWKKIIIFWDNDHYKPQNSGVIMAQNYSKEFNVPFIITPDVDKITDISDFVKEYGLEMGKAIINDALKYVK